MTNANSDLKLNIVFNAAEINERFPVFCKYPGQFQAQPAFIYLDLRDGECGADYNAAISGTPADQWHDIVLTFKIPAELTADQIETIINDNADKFQTILNGAAVEWDGSNNRGVLNDDARAAFDSLDHYGEGFLYDGFEGGIIDLEYFPTWIEQKQFPNIDQSVSEFAQELYNCDGDDGYYFSDDLNRADLIENALLNEWAEMLYSGQDLPAHVAQALIKAGTCDDSQWLEELNEFAAAK